MKVIITGARGVIGSKISSVLRQRHELRLLDKRPGTAADDQVADLSEWNAAWVSTFEGADAVIHLAANSDAQAQWPDLVTSNIDAMINVYEAARHASVGRVVFASSNHVMGGYKDQLGPGELTVDLPPKPGTQYVVDGAQRDSTPYATTKLLGERLGRHYADRHGLTVIAVRIGWNKPPPNRWHDIPASRGRWFQQMWLSDGDCKWLFVRCVEAGAPQGFTIVHGMSNNADMPWDLTQGVASIGYTPRDSSEQLNHRDKTMCWSDFRSKTRQGRA